MLNAMVRFQYDGSGLLIDLIETLHLSRNALGNGWAGHVENGSLQAIVIVSDGPTINDYTIETRLTAAGAPVTHATWPWYQSEPAGRWDTWTLTRIYVHPSNEIACRILG